jgi:hypothetical protein
MRRRTDDFGVLDSVNILCAPFAESGEMAPDPNFRAASQHSVDQDATVFHGKAARPLLLCEAKDAAIDVG